MKKLLNSKNKNNVLFLDSSGETAIISFNFFKDNEPFFVERKIKELSKNSLLQGVDNLFCSQPALFKEISYLIQVSGPGSYTGLRVGGIFAKSFSYLFKVNSFVCSKFDLLLDAVKPESGLILLLVKRSKNSFCSVFVDKNKNKISPFFDISAKNSFQDSFTEMKKKLMQHNLIQQNLAFKKFFSKNNPEENLQIVIENSFDQNREKILNHEIKYSFCSYDYFDFITKKNLKQKNYKEYSLFYG